MRSERWYFPKKTNVISVALFVGVVNIRYPIMGGNIVIAYSKGRIAFTLAT